MAKSKNKKLKEKDLNNIAGGWKLEGKYDEKTGKNTIEFEYNDKEMENTPSQLRNSLVEIDRQAKKSSKNFSNDYNYYYDEESYYY